MIRLEREPAPEVLARKSRQWTARFLDKRAASPSARPDSSKYAHALVRAALERMSHGKCFYCERKPQPSEPSHVDHYAEVTDAPGRAFAWDNLYLSCHGCNQAKRAQHTALADCIDPCDPHDDPAEHLTFDDEVIRPKHGSTRGRATIRKYALDRVPLSYERARALRELNRALIQIHRRRLAQGGRPLSPDEREILLSFAQPERPFSLMLRVALQGLQDV